MGKELKIVVELLQASTLPYNAAKICFFSLIGMVIGIIFYHSVIYVMKKCQTMGFYSTIIWHFAYFTHSCVLWMKVKSKKTAFLYVFVFYPNPNLIGIYVRV
jgi:hypothetical protein